MRRLGAALVLGLACAALFAPGAWAVGACDTIKRSRAVKHRPPSERPPLIIGDSTMLFAAPMLGRRGFEADARGCRQFTTGVAMLAHRKRVGRLPRVVVLALGANGPVARGSVLRAVRLVGRDRVLGLVTPRRSAGSDAAMRWAARRFGDRVLLIDWVAYSSRHGGWFGGDGLHVGMEGARGFADFVARRIAPLVRPPVRRLRLPRSVDRAPKVCGRRVVVTRGGERIACTRARALTRLPRLRPIPGWRFYDLRGVRRRKWTGAWMRGDGKVVVAQAARAAAARPRTLRAAARRPRILATGDSMMLLTDRELRRALGWRAHVMSDVRPATGLTKPHLFDWQAYAARQVRRKRPDVVVATMGANEAFPIGRATCCGVRWRVQYAKRISSLAAAWRRAGVDRVYWLTLPAPVESFLTPIFAGVDAAIPRARGIAVVDTRPILTPDGVFVEEVETSPGVRERIRSTDGVHLWWPGARLVAGAIAARLEADGVLPPAAG